MKEKIRILALSWRDIKSPNAGGAEVNTHEMLKRLNRQVYSVVHISPRFDNFEENEVIDGIRYIRHGNVFSVILFAMRYYKTHKNEFDFVIDQCNTHRFFTPLWVKREKRIFLIYQLTRDIWDINLKFPFNKIGKALEDPMLKMNRKDITITESESTRKDLLEVGFCEDRVFVIPVAMKIKPWNTNDFLEKREIPQFAYVGRHVKYKGIDDAVEAIGLLKREKIKTQLVVLGKKNEDYVQNNILPICRRYCLETYFPERFDVRQEGMEYRSADIIFAGFVSENDKLMTLSSARALVFPSNREGWGIPVSEAAYVGTPSIVYNSAGLTDAVDNGRAGFVCKEKSALGICEQMKITLMEEGLYKRMIKNAYTFSKQYLETDVSERMDEVVRSLMAD